MIFVRCISFLGIPGEKILTDSIFHCKRNLTNRDILSQAIQFSACQFLFRWEETLRGPCCSRVSEHDPGAPVWPDLTAPAGTSVSLSQCTTVLPWQTCPAPACSHGPRHGMCADKKVYDFGGVFFLLCTWTFFFQLNIQVQVIWNCKCSLNLEFKHHAAAEKILHFRVVAFRINRSKISHLGACSLHFLSLHRSLSQRKLLLFPSIHSLIDFYFEPESYSVVQAALELTM